MHRHHWIAANDQNFRSSSYISLCLQLVVGYSASFWLEVKPASQQGVVLSGHGYLTLPMVLVVRPDRAWRAKIWSDSVFISMMAVDSKEGFKQTANSEEREDNEGG